MEPRCPRCGRSDRVTKVSAAYTASLTRARLRRRLGGWDDGGSTGRERPSRPADSVLRELAPPREPLAPTDLTGCAKLLSAPLVLLALLGLALAATLGVVLVLRGFENLLAFGTAMVLLAVLSWGAVAFARWAVRGARARVEAKRRRREAERVGWRQASERWSRLYLCACDQGAFLPGVDRWIELPALRSFLFEEDPQEGEKPS